jgi:hypothetical protein
MVSAFTSACGTNTPVVEGTRTATTNVIKVSPTPSLPPTKHLASGKVLLIDEWPQNSFPMDTAQITAIDLEKNTLNIQVVFQGGCQEHIFTLHAETAFLQSNPPQGLLYLSHDSEGDSCTENMERLLSFDLAPLNQERNDPSERPLLLRIYEPTGGAFAKEPHMPLVEWP